MNKKFTKAAALSIAAVTALSAMALPVSADLTYTTGQVNTVDTIRGTASLVTWNVYSKTVTYTPLLNHSAVDDTALATVTGLSSGYDSLVATPFAAGKMAYSDNQEIQIGTAPYADKQVYFNSSANASNYTSKITNSVSYENTNAGWTGTNAQTAGKGEKAYQQWVSDWERYVRNINAWKACEQSTVVGATWKYEKKDGTYTTPVNKGDYATYAGFKGYATTTGGDTTFDDTAQFVKTVYSSSIVTNNNVSMTDLKTKFTTGKVDIAPATGIISAGTTWTIGANGTGTSTDPGSSTDTWYPALASERNVYSTLSYLGNNGKWYTSKALADKYGLGYSGTSKSSNWSDYSSSTSTIYFDAESGYYTTSDGTYRYVVKNKTDGFYSTSFGSYRAADGLYYPTITAAKNASYSFNGTTTYTTVYTTANARYFSVKTGNFYPSYTDAVNASGSSSYVIDLSTYKAPSAEYLGYYPNYIFGTSTGNKGTAYIYNSKKVAGWNSIRNYVSYKSKGSAVSIAMNKETTVPESILKAAKSKNVTLQFINSNGSAVVIKGSTITDASDTNVGVSYNAKVIPTSLKNKAKKSNKDVVSTAQIKIGDNGAIGATADVTVKLPAKRSGCTVKAYRYTSSGSLKLVDTSKVAKNGEVTITTDNGGYFLLVVCD